ncbi:leukocyte immunoglobulin-like receptor subfamily B member 4A isoform X5 [Peromyscus maniculatus bairdii]|uniref:leukocyte immunoglobulin-like receptor subfamily B member 4A isoform X5 n=1 Tax=Peromyscus maniculatus bairdii TaxID=230844 RepID=UPI003FD671B8
MILTLSLRLKKSLRVDFLSGLNVGQKTAVLAGTLTKPKIWAEPHSVIASNAPVTIWCQGSWEAKEYHLLKEGSMDFWDRQYPLESLDKAKFYIEHMTMDFAGIYKCNYQSPAGWSEHSDTLELVLTGVYAKPSLSVLPGPAVTSGETITMQCSSSLGFGRFILTQEGKHHLQWTLDSQQSANREFQAHFVLDPVTTIHNGTFRCYGYFRNRPQVWSKSSDSLHLLVSESKDQSPTHTENDASVMDPQPEESVELESWNPSDEEPQRIVYAQVKPSRLHRAGSTSPSPLSGKVLDMKNNQSGENREMYPQATTSKEPQDVTYAQLCRRTLEYQ